MQRRRRRVAKRPPKEHKDDDEAAATHRNIGPEDNVTMFLSITGKVFGVSWGEHEDCFSRLRKFFRFGSACVGVLGSDTPENLSNSLVKQMFLIVWTQEIGTGDECGPVGA
eukprot:TRINITY_DN11159_c0_g1_i1.p1 TRINITY_DN11159_c0_g1~~TRINITY_DN11159_c0_g1_i1.p1  ORF type:complete len:111 (-),score=9.54 TRINITY_DN11159_c0_g1_i1:558-890(-)